MSSVIVRPWVETDAFQAVLCDRYILGDILFDLYNDLPNNLKRYQTKRIRKTTFWYERTYSLNLHTFDFRFLRFVVSDFNPSELDVIWVVVEGQ